MNRLGCFTIILAILCVLAAAISFPEHLGAGLGKLGIPPDLALIYFVAMLAGSAINIPIWSFPTPRLVHADPLAVLGLEGLLPHLAELRKRAIISVNVGGCILPGAIATYEVARLLASENPHGTLIALLLASSVNAAVCWKLARPVSGVGLALPGLVPPLVAAASALLLKSSVAPPIAFVAGVFGPITGGILRLPSLKERPVATASLGGAGTFDSVLLGAVAAALVG